uniref:Uncharacterized protein n=1 Tax=Lepeophtheirus salmonis TaxID=72036 RepID=A0A0K2T4C6_LEPSM
MFICIHSPDLAPRDYHMFLAMAKEYKFPSFLPISTRSSTKRVVGSWILVGKKLSNRTGNAWLPFIIVIFFIKH